MTAIVVFGATGRTGAHILDRALQRGHQVTAAARRPEALGEAVRQWSATGRLTVVTADVRDREAVGAAVAGSQVVISAIASAGRQPHELFSAGTHAIVESLQRHHIPRFLCISSRGVNHHDPALPLLYRRVIRPVFLREVYRDMQKMEDTVRSSDLEWTLIRAPKLTDGAARATYRVEDGHNPFHGWTLSRADLAAFTVDEIEAPHWIRRTPTLAY